MFLFLPLLLPLLLLLLLDPLLFLLLFLLLVLMLLMLPILVVPLLRCFYLAVMGRKGTELGRMGKTGRD